MVRVCGTVVTIMSFNFAWIANSGLPQSEASKVTVGTGTPTRVISLRNKRYRFTVSVLNALGFTISRFGPYGTASLITAT